MVFPTRTSVFKNFLAIIISRPDTQNMTDGHITNTITKTLHPTIFEYLWTNKDSSGKSPRSCAGSKLFKQLSKLNTFHTPCYIPADRGKRQPCTLHSFITPGFLPNQTPPTDSSCNYKKFHATSITNFNRVTQTSVFVKSMCTPWRHVLEWRCNSIPFRHVGKIAKNNEYYLRQICLSVRLQGKTRLSMNGFWLNLIFQNF